MAWWEWLSLIFIWFVGALCVALIIGPMMRDDD